MIQFFPTAPVLIKRYPILAFSLVLLVFGLAELFLRHFELTNLIFTLMIIIGGIPLVYETVKEVIKGNWGADVIAALAIITSLLLKEYLAGAVIIIMLSGGRALEDFALQNASNALRELANRAPQIAHLVRGEEVADIKVDQVRSGDELLVKPGELIPVDGVVIEGETSLNESALTGESVPVHKTFNSAVLSGSVNLDRAVKIKAIRPASESKYEQIVRLVKSAQETKAPIHRLADIYGAIFTPLTLIVALFAFLLSHNVVNVLAVLVVATPCPLILATPIAIMGGINRAAKGGIIIKNGGSLEKVGQTRAVVFDKTGTLTFGTPKVIEVKSFGKLTEKEIVEMAASVERLSAHILAKAVLEKAAQLKLSLGLPQNFKEDFGKGVMGRVGKKEVTFSNSAYLENFGIEINKDWLDFKKRENELGRMVSFLVVDKKLEGAVVFGDEIRSDIKEVINRLRRAGAEKIVMLTGDNEKVAAQVAAQTGIDEVKAQSLPDEKVAFLKDYQRQFQNVVMVGDGFNDAPALATATVGIALGAGGSSVSSESADVVLVVDNLEKIRELIEVGKKVLSVAKGGIFFGMGASFVAMLFASFGYIQPVEGAILQEVIDVIVIFNALRAAR